MTNTERRRMTLDCALPNHRNAGFAARGSLRPIADGKLWRWLKKASQNPLTFVFLVWAAMLLMTVLFLAFID